MLFPPKKIVVHEPLLKVGCTLGEGPIYDSETKHLHFVDIVEKKVFHFDTVTHELTVDSYSVPITSLALRQNQAGLACTTSQGFALLESAPSVQYLSKPLPEKDAAMIRFNDGACDSRGRYFAGTVQSADRTVPGKLWRFDPSDSSCVVVDEGPFTDSNGIGWSPDEKTCYFTDSFNNLIYAYDYDEDDGNLSNRRVLVDAVKSGYSADSYCDGLCVDTEGHIWSARWGGSSIVRFTSSGSVDVEIEIPTALHVTACCFGGPNMDQLYITSAHCGCLGGDPGRQSKYFNSGDLFVVDLSGQYQGLPRHPFAG